VTIEDLYLGPCFHCWK